MARSRDEAGERLRKRTRQLAAANALGTRLSAMTDVGEILEAVVDELHRAFGFFLCAAVRLRPDGHVESAAVRGDAFLALGAREWSQPRDVGLIGRCLREGRPVVSGDVQAEPDFLPVPETIEVVRSELVVPLYVAGELWGVLNVEEIEPDAFHEDDVRLMETMADQAGSALRSASLYEQLERAYMGTAEALAAALEAKDSYTANHARSIVEHAEAVGRRLGMDARQLQDLRFGAVFHDIGKIAVPEQILNKRGPLTAEERARDRAPHRRRRADPRARSSSSRARVCSCATSTSAGTAAATRTGSRAPTSRSARGSSSPATHCTR